MNSSKSTEDRIEEIAKACINPLPHIVEARKSAMVRLSAHYESEIASLKKRISDLEEALAPFAKSGELLVVEGRIYACRSCGSTATRSELDAGGWVNCCPERAMNEVIEVRHGTPALEEVKVELRKIVARAMRDYARTENYLDMADAAIAVMWPVMREMCAVWHDNQAARIVALIESGMTDVRVAALMTHEQSATAIRCLLPTELAPRTNNS
jgi:hypothetical protein